MRRFDIGSALRTKRLIREAQCATHMHGWGAERTL